ncbi:MAG: DUF362 domain-containing protein [Candidatus Omnitrophica bacterium]|nr:DUF362 domain-containing protein [Candidatus Omnitrophota bacterium]
MKSKVSIIRCNSYNIEGLYAAVKKSIDLIGGIENFVKRGQKVLLKPNLLKKAKPEEAVTTHPEFIRAVIKLVKTQTDNIFIGDSPGGTVRAQAVYEFCGIEKVAREEKIQLIGFNSIVKKDNIPFAKIIDEVDVIISMPKFKTHNLAMITAAVKNVFGLIPGLYKVHAHKQSPNFIKFGNELARVYSLATPNLSIVDAVVAMDGDGPAGGDPYDLGLVVASSDAVSIDAILSKIVGLKPLSVPSTKASAHLNLGQADINNIDILGVSLEAIIVRDFKLPKILTLFKVPNFLTRSLLRFIPLMMGIDRNRCNECQVCKNICPQGAIKNIRGRLKLDFRRCILCLCCSEMCPNNAIYLRFLTRRKKRAK